MPEEISSLSNKNTRCEVKIQQDYDVVDGYFEYVVIPEEILDELGWDEDTELDLTIRLGTNGNVLVVQRKKA